MSTRSTQTTQYIHASGPIIDMRWYNGKLQQGRAGTLYQNDLPAGPITEWTDVREVTEPKPTATR
jgi:hypothetical protein